MVIFCPLVTEIGNPKVRHMSWAVRIALWDAQGVKPEMASLGERIDKLEHIGGLDVIGNFRAA
ncbi:hypothetical protein GCE9029_04448 [Grimontia celer]|uniref:Uncharacterized protein n=1 Tax=Grimontia celer TaxID=1796497 RepID=A0A128FCN4_9GAMM|nr:hypothetical protein GCE9029_04448 [Grimontia celer]